MKDKRILIAHNNGDDPDGNKHDFLMYKYKDYIFRKEWYMNMENEYKLGLTLFKKGDMFEFAPTFKFDDEYYYEIFHSGSFVETNEDGTGSDDETIEMVEMVIKNERTI